MGDYFDYLEQTLIKGEVVYTNTKGVTYCFVDICESHHQKAVRFSIPKRNDANTFTFKTVLSSEICLAREEFEFLGVLPSYAWFKAHCPYSINYGGCCVLVLKELIQRKAPVTATIEAQ